MPETVRESPFKGHRVDEVGVHRRRFWESTWTPLAVFLLLVVALILFLALGGD